MKRGDSDTSNSGVATAGIVLGIIGTILGVILVAIIAVSVIIANRTVEDLKQLEDIDLEDIMVDLEDAMDDVEDRSRAPEIETRDFEPPESSQEALPDFELPERPSVTVPDYDIPEISIPEITIPEITIPGVESTISLNFEDDFGPYEVKAYDIRVRSRNTQRTQRTWQDFCDTVTSDADRLARSAEVTLEIYGTTEAFEVFEVQYRSRNSSTCTDGSPDEWSAIEDITAVPSIRSVSTTVPSNSPLETEGAEGSQGRSLDCYEGLVVRPGEMCLYPRSSQELSVDADGKGRWSAVPFVSFEGPIDLEVTTERGIERFVARPQGDGSWIVEIARVDSATSN